MTIDIVLATYNGARYLPNLLDSLTTQTHQDWRLIARDDGSSDDTVELLALFQRASSNKVSILRRGSDEPAGAMQNFSAALSHSTAPYVCFADQDDVWMPSKLADLYAKMLEVEASHGREKPVLVHSDLQVVGESLEPMSESFFDFQNLDPIRGSSLNRLLVRNVVTGCAMMINGRLRELGQPIPKDAVMHDWWLALVATLFGTVECVAQPLIMYRQHGMNTVGAQQAGVGFVMRRMISLRRNRERTYAKCRQAQALLDRFGDTLPLEARKLLQLMASLHKLGPLSRRWMVLRYGLADTGIARNLGLWISL